MADFGSASERFDPRERWVAFAGFAHGVVVLVCVERPDSTWIDVGAAV